MENLIVRCTPGETLVGCICANHFRLLFNMEIVHDTLITFSGQKQYKTKQVLTGPTENIIPFPFRYVEDKFCLVKPQLESSFREHIQRIPTKSDADRHKLLRLVQGMLLNTYVMINNARDICVQLAAIGEYLSEHAGALSVRTDTIQINVKTAANQYTNVSLSKFPVFYRLVLYYMEASIITVPAVGAGAVATNHYLPWNVEVDAVTGYIRHRALASPYDTCIQKDDATWASPLIVRGTRTTAVANPFANFALTSTSYTTLEEVPLCPTV